MRRSAGDLAMNATSKSYFRKSPFRSVSFNTVTAVLIVFVLSGIRAIREQSPALKASSAIFGLMLLPIAVWIFSLFLHSEIRAVIERADENLPCTQLTQLGQSRLSRMHWGMVLGITVVSYGIIQGLMNTVAR